MRSLICNVFVMSNNIIIGKIIKAQGIKGELKVKPLTDDVLRYNKLKTVIIGGANYLVRRSRTDGGFAYLSLGGIDERNKAELLVGEDVCVDRENAVKLPSDTYFIADVIGCEVLTDTGRRVGKVSYVYQNGAADVYEVKCENKSIVMFPFITALNAKVDVLQKKIIVNEQEFNRVAVYED